MWAIIEIKNGYGDVEEFATYELAKTEYDRKEKPWMHTQYYLVEIKAKKSDGADLTDKYNVEY